jgi:hypothetical protein
MSGLNGSTQAELHALALLSRTSLLRGLGLDGDSRDLNKDAGYPERITKFQYREMYDREGVAARVVNVMPDECWSLDPIIYENNDEEETEFEKRWGELNRSHQLIHYLHRIDRISGIGHFGLVFFGINDGKKLHEPVDGLPLKSEFIEKDKEYKQHELMFIRVFDETLVEIKAYEKDPKNPRYGKPVLYDIKLVDPQNDEEGAPGKDVSSVTIHWHRVLHVADNRESSEIFGTPRQRCIYNRLHDLRKTLGGSGEMFWKGGFPGYSFEMDPELAATATIDEASLKEQIANYYNGLERYMTLKGLQAKSLAPQVASPKDHVYVQIQAICVAIGVPMRVFVGSEEAKLSSTQDAITWNKRLQRRQDKYVSPLLITPFVNKLVMLGILPKPENLLIVWPDLNTSTNTEKADVAEKMTKAMALYVEGGLSQIMTPTDFMVHFMDMTKDAAEMVWKRAQKEEIELENALTQAAASQEAQLNQKAEQEKVKQENAAKPATKTANNATAS